MKILILGIAKAGKTSWLLTLDNKTEQIAGIRPTQGVAYNQIPYAGFSLALWDVAGQDRFVSFRDTFYRGAHAVALVYDVTSPASFFNLPHWRDEIQSVVPMVPMVVIGNKVDLFSVIPPDEAQGWAKGLNMPFLLTSAATGERVSDFFAGLAYLAIQEQQRREEREKAQTPPPNQA